MTDKEEEKKESKTQLVRLDKDLCEHLRTLGKSGDSFNTIIKQQTNFKGGEDEAFDVGANKRHSF